MDPIPRAAAQRAKFKSPVVTPDEEDNPVAATREAEGLDEVEIRELRKRREAERAKKRVGLNGKRIVESTLAASFHPDNRVMSAGRDALENNMARRLGGACLPAGKCDAHEHRRRGSHDAQSEARGKARQYGRQRRERRASREI